MNLIHIKENIGNGKNLMFYKKNVYDCFKELKKDYLCIYYNEPLPIKIRLVDSINFISGYSKTHLNRLAITELTKLLIDELKSTTLIILFNHFERLTERSLQIYQYLNSRENIHFICSFSIVKTFKPDVYLFLGFVETLFLVDLCYSVDVVYCVFEFGFFV
ncbi:hypothetical protein GCM10025860_22330 [Methanobacterium ferruginis]|nr:hypothetical protein GCM10025860_22330 [Methanobacterium ferruginis]